MLHMMLQENVFILLVLLPSARLLEQQEIHLQVVTVAGFTPGARKARSIRATATAA